MIALAQLLLASSAQAIDCAEPVTQSAMNICADQAYRAADDALNAQWNQTAALMRERDGIEEPPGDGRPGHFDSLLEAQRAWLAFRDAHCRLEGYNARGGSLEPMLVSLCLEHVTRERTEQLRQLTFDQVSGEPREGA